MKQGYTFTIDVANKRPYIEKADIATVTAVDWRTAKKQLRRWYLDQAAALRKTTEKDYFN